jgi:multidrug efflux pump subunit AcrA (membrane-fusion protein)
MLAFFTLGIAGCAKKDAAGGPGGPGGAAAATVFAVNTAKVETGSIADYIALSGDITADSMVDAFADAAGKVSRMLVSVGQSVSRGQAIAHVDPSRPGMEYNISVVESPITGTVVALPAVVGMTVSQASPIARISASASLKIKLYVPERFISKMALNLPCEIRLDAWPGDSFRGFISELSPVVDPASRTMEMSVNVDNSSRKLKPGMFSKVHIITERKENVVRIPANAMQSRFGEDYVFVAADNPDTEAGGKIAKKITIKPGIAVDAWLEVEEGLAAGDDIIIRGQTLLTDGALINVIQ